MSMFRRPTETTDVLVWPDEKSARGFCNSDNSLDSAETEFSDRATRSKFSAGLAAELRSGLILSLGREATDEDDYVAADGR